MRRRVREFCVIEFCIVMHCGADRATGAPQPFVYNNKLQFSDPTTNRAVGSSNLSGRARKTKGSLHGTPFSFQLPESSNCAARRAAFDPRRACEPTDAKGAPKG